MTSALPLQGWGYGMPFQRADKPIVDRANRRACFFKMISASYFRALGMKLRRGRPLGDHDAKGAPAVTVINESMERLYFKGEEPIGFVNVAWDGGDHAFLLDTKTHGTFQRNGIGTRLVEVATRHAKAAGCEWLHVDFDPELEPFYFDSCGFRPTPAGLIHLPSASV